MGQGNDQADLEGPLPYARETSRGKEGGRPRKGGLAKEGLEGEDSKGGPRKGRPRGEILERGASQREASSSRGRLARYGMSQYQLAGIPYSSGQRTTWCSMAYKGVAFHEHGVE